MDKNRELCELLGICWHEQVDYNTLQCKHCGTAMLFPWQHNPDFTTDAGKVMRAVEDKDVELLKEFVGWLTRKLHEETGNSCIALCELFKDTTGLLRDKAIEWLRWRKG